MPRITSDKTEFNSFQVLICAVIGMAAAVGIVVSDESKAEVLSRKEDVRPDGFEALLETSNSIIRKESGDEKGNIQGVFSWVSPEGEKIEVSYVADENGYQPKSDSLPTPPPIPDEIERALKWIAANPPAPDSKN
ncbi:PREDICTED: larval cuticle protein 2-like isoform X1 [Drosophila arizonae]|uniref:Larval cuticle protein 2-like isoform X1 n=2 Tax=mojavensis species complex TaxID=198037 RepID=A0ABM1PL82_DROAR|nr:PREDICTED: larval cuticle protein 2-like isoform X1 [Drosophila arizonae]